MLVSGRASFVSLKPLWSPRPYAYGFDVCSWNWERCLWCGNAEMATLQPSIPGSSKCVKCVPKIIQKTLPFKAEILHMEDPGMYHANNTCSIKNWMGPYQRTPKKVTRAIKYPGLGVRSVGPVGDFLDMYNKLLQIVSHSFHFSFVIHLGPQVRELQVCAERQAEEMVVLPCRFAPQI